MKTSQSFDSAQELFFKDMTEQLGDRVQSVEMVCITASESTWEFMQLTPPGRQKELWGLLIFCEQSIHFYVHPSESPMVTMFRAASSRKPPIEQFFSFSSFSSWVAEPIVKRGIFGERHGKFDFLVRFTYDKSDSLAAQPTQAGKSTENDNLLIVRTQIKSADILKKVKSLQIG